LPSQLRIHGALFTVALLFSANYIFAKLGMREFSPLAFAWLRIAGAALLLAGFMRGGEPLSRDDSRRVTGFAVLGVAVNATLFIVGLSLTTVQTAAVLITAIPVFAAATAIVLGYEVASAHRIGGIALAGAGALLVVGGETFTGSWRSVGGAVMIILNCLSYALYLVISKPVMARLSAKRVVARMFAIGTLFLFPVSAWSLWHQEWHRVSARAWIVLLLSILGPTVLAYLLNAWALRYADSSLVAAYTYVQPALAAVLGAIFLGEPIRVIAIVAAAMIFSGVWLAGRANTRAPGTM
jgi:drug/metabolite transporter (DMT)-like permease